MILKRKRFLGLSLIITDDLSKLEFAEVFCYKVKFEFLGFNILIR